MKNSGPPPALWVVIDEKGVPIHAATWPDDGDQYIKEAQQDPDYAEATKWRVRLYFLAEVQPS